MSRLRRTEGGHDPFLIISLLQKAIRRADARLSLWAVHELARSSYRAWAWRRLLTTASEDCTYALVSPELLALHRLDEMAVKHAKSGKRPPTRVHVSKAVLLLCVAPKSRDSDHAGILLLDAGKISEDEVATAIEEAERDPEPEIPDYAYDVHTPEGRRRGATKAEFIKDEHAALDPRVRGLFDDLVQE